MFKVHVAGYRRGLTKAIKRALRRRAAVEPVIGHLKQDHRMGRNFLTFSKATPTTPCSPPSATPVWGDDCQAYSSFVSSSPGSASWRPSPRPDLGLRTGRRAQ